MLNRAVAGYHMLVILAGIDGKEDRREHKIIVDFMREYFSKEIDFDYELSFLQTIPEIDYPVHFNNAMNDFYIQSTQEERNHFLDLATRLVAADKNISRKENLFLNELYIAWEEATEEWKEFLVLSS